MIRGGEERGGRGSETAWDIESGAALVGSDALN